MDAWERLPSRSEPLYELAVRARTRGDFELADWATAIGIGIPFPRDGLFVHAWVYDWGMALERSIAAAHLGGLDEALALTDELLARDGLPGEVMAALDGNRRWLLKHGADSSCPVDMADHRHRHLGRLCARTDFVPLPVAALRRGWAQTNPSIASDREALAFISRAVNYELDGSGYRIPTGDGAVRTENALVSLAADFSLTGCRTLIEPDALPRHPTGVLGFEDCRLFWWRDGWWAVATSRDLDPHGICRMVLLRVAGNRWQLEASCRGRTRRATRRTGCHSSSTTACIWSTAAARSSSSPGTSTRARCARSRGWRPTIGSPGCGEAHRAFRSTTGSCSCATR